MNREVQVGFIGEVVRVDCGGSKGIFGGDMDASAREGMCEEAVDRAIAFALFWNRVRVRLVTVVVDKPRTYFRYDIIGREYAYSAWTCRSLSSIRCKISYCFLKPEDRDGTALAMLSVHLTRACSFQDWISSLFPRKSAERKMNPGTGTVASIPARFS